MSAPNQSRLFDLYGLPARHVDQEPAPALPTTERSRPAATTTLAPMKSVPRKRAPLAGKHRTHEMHRNSLDAYREQSDEGKLSKRCSEILTLYRQLGELTDRQVLKASTYNDMNQVRPRISELIDQGLLEEGVLNGGEVLVQRDDAASARLVGERDDLHDNGFAIGAAEYEDRRGLLQCGHEDLHGKLQHHCAYGPSDDNHCGGGLGDLSDAAAFDHHAGHDADDGECDATDAGDIHNKILFR